MEKKAGFQGEMFDIDRTPTRPPLERSPREREAPAGAGSRVE